jgi:hypothetical protein
MLSASLGGIQASPADAVDAATAMGCIGAPCFLSANYEWDSAAADAARVDTVQFAVPSGYGVQILTIIGDEVAATYSVPTGTAYVLIGFTNSTPFADSEAKNTSQGCFVYHQGVIQGQNGVRVPVQAADIPFPVLLNPDGKLLVKQAVFMNQAGLVHMEVSFVVWFKFIPLGQNAASAAR